MDRLFSTYSSTTSSLVPSRSSTSRNSSTSSSSNLEYLYEFEYLPDDSKVPLTDLPFLNPYNAFVRPQTSVKKTVTQLFSTKRPISVKEYVQASKFDQCFIAATEAEQLLPLEIPVDLPRLWQQQGFTHLHFGAIRLAVTFHGRKGLPVTSRIALVDTRFMKYQHACIATVQTTLNAGTVIFTFYPNFNMPLADPHLLTALKVQVQIGGASQISTTYAATLHYQMAYRLQNHAFDMSLPSSTDEALFLTVNAPHQASCVHVPRQISRPELLKLLPESWVTAFEKNQHQPIPVQSSNPLFETKPDGTVEITFPKEASASSSTHPVIFPSRIDMFVDGSRPEPPIKYFQSSGLPVFYFKNPETGHCYFDACNCDECAEESFLDDDEKYFNP